MNARFIYFCGAIALAVLSDTVAAHAFDGSPDPLPSWVPITALVILGTLGGILGFVVSKHRQSLQEKQKRRQQNTAAAEVTQAESPRPGTGPALQIPQPIDSAPAQPSDTSRH